MRVLWTSVFFSSRRRHTRFDCDWSSDVCSSDLVWPVEGAARPGAPQACSHPRAPLGCAAVNAPPGTIVVALGGNAVAPPGERPTISNQFRHTRASLAPIVELARQGWHIALVHGNGPQAGAELARNQIAADQVQPLPLGVRSEEHTSELQ